MEILANLSLGFSTAFHLANLFYCFIGVVLGTLMGVLPGLGPVATIAMLLPITFSFEPVTSLIMLAGIFYGAQYGGSTTAILVNLPGEASSVITALDGHAMARKGQAGKALATAAIGSFIAGTIATFLIALFAPPLAEVALKFGPAEYFSLLVMGLIVSIVLAHGSLLHAIGMILLGLLCGIIGTDVNSGAERFTFGAPWLADGIGLVVLAMGMYGVGEIINNLEKKETRDLMLKHVSGLKLTWAEFKQILPAILRGTGIGSFLGYCPAAVPCFRRLRLTRSKRSSRKIRFPLAKARSRVWPDRNRPTMPALRRRSSRC
jgi:TctA family transporter